MFLFFFLFLYYFVSRYKNSSLCADFYPHLLFSTISTKSSSRSSGQRYIFSIFAEKNLTIIFSLFLNNLFLELLKSMIKYNRNNYKSALYDGIKPFVMGIVNCTPDSFHESSRCVTSEQLLDKIRNFMDSGADIIDLGACSTRPGGVIVSENEEEKRLFSALEVIRRDFPEIVLSVDTFRADIADRAVRDFGVDIINDVSAFGADEKMLEVVADLNVPYVLMHCSDTSGIVSNSDFMMSVLSFFEERLSMLSRAGVENVILDPGYGFGKSMEQNFHLLSHQSLLKRFGLPLLSGLSRKRMVWQTLGCTPADSLNGSTVLNVLAMQQGTAILRVHDVKEAVEVVRLYETYRLFSES